MKMSGLETVLRNLDRASNGVQNTASRKAVVEAGRVIVRQARANATRITGTLRRSLVAAYSKKRSQKNVVQVALVRARAGIRYQPKQRVTRKGKQSMTKNADAYYAGWVEFGHKIVPRGKSSITVRRRASTSYGPPKHVRPYPFLAPAYRSHGRQALKALEDSLRASLKNGST